MLKERDGQWIEELNNIEVMRYEGSGGGGGEEAHTPVETPNNLLSVAYAKVLIAVGEGELAGNPTGKDIYLGGTPLLAEDGSSNFGGVTWEWRSGSQSQSYIQGMPEVSNEVSVGIEIKQSAPWIRLITKKSLSAYRLTLQWPALMRQKQNGDTVGYKIEYAVDISKDGGPFALYKQYTVEGKTNTAYERTHRIDLPQNVATGWSIRVRRITADSESSLIQDTMNLKSYAEVIDAKQRYPNTALLFVSFDSRLFGGGSIPKISVKTKGRLVRVPFNYDPATRTYSGIWSGEFKWAYTNNPAWVFFDICTQSRFGLGSRISTSQVDKWELYEIAKYCDVMVDDGTGAGTKQPRHTCNIYIQSVADAYQVLRDICSIFNGMSYWDGSQFVAVADKPEDVTNIPLFSRSNVLNGDFNYQTTDERSIYTSALVSYDEPTDHYGTQVEAVWERSEILRWGGDRQTTLSAIGCTSRGEAQRKGKYTLLTNILNRTVAFKTGLEGLSARVRPGSIIGVADPLISGKAFTGRLVAAVPTVITLDRDTEAKVGDTLFITMKDGIQQGRTVKAVSGRVITVTTAYTQEIMLNSVWYLEASDMKTQLFKVIRLAPGDDGTFEVNAVEYNESKFAAIDNGARLEPRPISKVPPSAQQSPTPVTIKSSTYVEQTMSVTNMTISWPKTKNAILYEGEWRVGEGDWVTLGTTGAQEFNVKGVYTGDYVARVRAINALDIKSLWTLSPTTTINGKTGAPSAITSLTVTPLIFGMRLNWTFPPLSSDTARTEIMYSKTTSFAQAVKLGDFSYPQNTHDVNGLAAGTTFYFWARLVDRTGNIGAYFPLTTFIGVQGKSSTNVLEYEEYFKDQINESALGQDLASKIDLIPVLDGKLNWIDSQVSGLENQLQNDIEYVNTTLDTAVENLNKDLVDLNIAVGDIQEQVANITDALVYDPTKTYVKGDAVRVGNRLYQAKVNVPVNNTPPNETYWQDVGEVITGYGALASQVSTNTASITSQGNTITAQGQAITGLTTRIGTVESGVSGNSSAIESLKSTVTQQGNNITSQGQAITALTGRVDTATTDITGIKAVNTAQGSAITGLTTTQTSQGNTLTSHTSSITALDSSVATLKTDVSGLKTQQTGTAQAVTNLTNTVTAQGNTITSQAGDITTLKANVTTITTDVNGLKTTVTGQGTAINNLQTTVTAQGNDITANSNNITALTSEVHFKELDGLYDGGEMEGQIADAIYIARGTASATESLTSEVKQQGNTITAQAQSLTELKASLEGISGDVVGQGTAIETLKTTVTAQGNLLTSQGTAITSLNNSLTTTNTNVTAAQQAAQAASDKAGTKGEVIYGTTAPTVAQRLPQNLWIDTTSNANTPKRWNGTAWVVVTDKVATDAAAAAASALTQLSTKADASALQALTTTVTAQGNLITANAGNITSLSTELHFKELDSLYDDGETEGQLADALNIASGASRAAESLQSSVTQQGGVITAQAEKLVSLETTLTTVDGKVAAQGTAITSLQSTTTAQGNTITSQGSAITQVQSTLGGIGGGGNNLLNDVYSWLTSATLPATYVSGLSRVGVAVSASSSGWGYKATTSTATNNFLMLCPSNNAAGFNTDIDAGTYLVSMYVQGSSAGTMRVSLYDGTHRYSPTIAFTTSRQRLTFVCTSSNSARVGITLYPNMSGAVVDVTVDSVMIEKQLGNSVVPSPFVAGNSAGSVSASALAVSSLTTKVTEVDGKVSAVGTRVDGLQVTVGNNTSAIQQTNNAVVALDGKASAMWSVKLQVNSQGQYVAAGVGLGIENGPAGLQSTFLVSADKFAVVNGANATLSTPFVVTGGQVFIKDAFIANGSINMLKIGDNLQSDNYVAGVSGWRLLKSGNFEINGSVAGQGKMVMTNRSLRVYDANNVKRVQLGDLTE